jgi:hypothetical protein
MNGKVSHGKFAGIYVVSMLMLVFGMLEIITGFMHRFVLLATTSNALATFAGVTLGAFYFVAGLLVLPRRKWAGVCAIGLLGADVIGRVVMVVAGLYPVNTFLQVMGILIGTSIAAFFAIYIGLKLKTFK